MTLSRTLQNFLLFFFTVLVLFFNFFDHRLSSLSRERFADNEFPSERYVFSRLVYDLEHGTKADGGFMLRYDHVEPLYKSEDMKDYETFEKGLPGHISTLYDSHLGLQDDLVWPIWSGLAKIKEKILTEAREGSRWHKRATRYSLYYYNKISQGAVALLNAMVIALIVIWAAREYKTPVAGLFLLAAIIVFMPALTFFGRSMWWMMWSWFLPFLASLWFYHWNAGRPLRALPLLFLSALVGAGVCLRGTMGYEYISTVGIAAVVPAAYYALRNSWNFKTWFLQSLMIGLFALGGLACTLWLHWNALSATGEDPLAVILERYQMRAYGGSLAPLENKQVIQSLKTSTIAVIVEYLYHPQKIAWPQILLMLPFLLWCKNYFGGARQTASAQTCARYDSLVAAITVGFIGSVSMLVALKSHAAIHGFDIVVWNLPTNFFLALFYWQYLQDRYTRKSRTPAH